MMRPWDLVRDRTIEDRAVERLQAALTPDTTAPLEHLTLLSEVWRGYVEAVAEVDALDALDGPDAERITDAEKGRDRLEALLVATPPRSPADAIVQLIYVAKMAVHKTLDDKSRVRVDFIEGLEAEDLIIINAVLALMAPGVLGRIAEALTPPDAAG